MALQLESTEMASVQVPHELSLQRELDLELQGHETGMGALLQLALPAGVTLDPDDGARAALSLGPRESQDDLTLEGVRDAPKKIAPSVLLLLDLQEIWSRAVDEI